MELAFYNCRGPLTLGGTRATPSAKGSGGQDCRGKVEGWGLVEPCSTNTSLIDSLDQYSRSLKTNYNIIYYDILNAIFLDSSNCLQFHLLNISNTSALDSGLTDRGIDIFEGLRPKKWKYILSVLEQLLLPIWSSVVLLYVWRTVRDCEIKALESIFLTLDFEIYSWLGSCHVPAVLSGLQKNTFHRFCGTLIYCTALFSTHIWII